MISKKPEDKNESRFQLIRILSTDIPSNKSLYSGLTLIKGVSWSFSNALCNKLNISKEKKISELTKEEIKKIEDFIRNPVLPSFLLNRRKDRETGKSRHVSVADADLEKEFDIKRLKKIRSYRGLRHALGQPVRGQRTRSHFRKRGKSVGVSTKSGGKKG